MKYLAQAVRTGVCVAQEMSFARAVTDHVILMADGDSGCREQLFTTAKREITRVLVKLV